MIGFIREMISGHATCRAEGGPFDGRTFTNPIQTPETPWHCTERVEYNGRASNWHAVYRHREKKRLGVYIFELDTITDESPEPPPVVPVVVPPFEGKVKPTDSDLVRQRERAEDLGIVQLYDQMRAEVVQQVRDILGVETEPSWWFFTESSYDITERFLVVIEIDGLGVQMTDKGRLWVSEYLFSGSRQRLRTKADFEQMLHTRAFNEDYSLRHRD